MEYESYVSQIYGQNSFNYPDFIKWAISEIKGCPKWPKLLFLGQFCILEAQLMILTKNLLE